MKASDILSRGDQLTMNGRKLDIKKAVPRANNSSFSRYHGKNNYHDNRGGYSQSHRGPPISTPGPTPYHNTRPPVAIIPSINPYDPHQRESSRNYF